MIEGIRQQKGGVVIDIEVSPNSKKEGIKGYNEWRKRIIVTMKEKPEKFKVNRELISYFSSLFCVPQEDVSIVSGEKNPHKTIFIRGVSAEQVAEIIKERLGKIK